MSLTMPLEKTVLITGSARRIGRAIAEYFHDKNYNIILHYHCSKEEAEVLANTLNARRSDSVFLVSADLTHTASFSTWVKKSVEHFGRLDVLINNASCFYRTPFDSVTEEMWDHTMTANLKSCFFLAQAVKPYLMQTNGNIVNITDIKAIEPLNEYSVYCIAKSGLWMMTKALARELAPLIRVNAVAPGAMIWPEGSETLSDEVKASIVNKIPMQRIGSPDDIAKTAYFLAETSQSGYITGQMIQVDGGRSR